MTSAGSAKNRGMAPTISPDGRWVAAARAGGVELFATDGSEHRTLGSSDHSDVSWGRRSSSPPRRWSALPACGGAGPDRLLMTKVDDSPVGKWWISIPRNPPPPQRRSGIPLPERTTPSFRCTWSIWPVSCGKSRGTATSGSTWPGCGGTTEGHSWRWDRSQSSVLTAAVDPGSGTLRELRRDSQGPWVELVPGAPRWMDWGLAVVEVSGSTDTRRLVALDDSGTPVCTTPPGLQVHSLSAHDADSVTFVGSDVDPSSCDLWRLSRDGTLTGCPKPAAGRREPPAAGRLWLLAHPWIPPRRWSRCRLVGRRGWCRATRNPDLDIAPVFLTDAHGWSRIAVLFPAGGGRRVGRTAPRDPVALRWTRTASDLCGRPVRSQRSNGWPIRASASSSQTVPARRVGRPTSSPSTEIWLIRPWPGRSRPLDQVAAEFGDRIDTNRVGIGAGLSGLPGGVGRPRTTGPVQAAVAGRRSPIGRCTTPTTPSATWAPRTRIPRPMPIRRCWDARRARSADRCC